MMQPLAVDLRALRTLVGPDIKIVPGRAMMARVVVAEPGGRGSLSIAGLLLEAELPSNVRTGDELRLVVRDVNAERVLLAIADRHETPPGAAQTPAAPATPVDPPQTWPAAAQPLVEALPPIPLPGGATVRVTERDAGDHGRGGGASRSHALTLRYDAPDLGAMDLRFQLDPASLRLTVSVSPGRPLELAQADAARLRQALSDALPTHPGVSVTVVPRREPLDVYA
jgi:hypothetical protein